MDMRAEMNRNLLGCINSPDLTMHFRMGFRMLQSQSQFDLEERFELS